MVAIDREKPLVGRAAQQRADVGRPTQRGRLLLRAERPHAQVAAGAGDDSLRPGRSRNSISCVQRHEPAAVP